LEPRLVDGEVAQRAVGGGQAVAQDLDAQAVEERRLCGSAGCGTMASVSMCSVI
jgi:hypothetical protein